MLVYLWWVFFQQCFSSPLKDLHEETIPNHSWCNKSCVWKSTEFSENVPNQAKILCSESVRSSDSFGDFFHQNLTAFIVYKLTYLLKVSIFKYCLALLFSSLLSFTCFKFSLSVEILSVSILVYWSFLLINWEFHMTFSLHLL